MSSDQPPSQQPSPELLVALGIKVRDFAYENTLPAIVPVPRVPRQVQPAPRPLKRSQRDWDAPVNSPLSTKKPRLLERKPTEPLLEPAVPHTRTLERITVRRVCSIIIPALPLSPHTRLNASPPTSPLTPPLSQRDADLPFVVRVDDTTMIPASRADAESCRPARYTTFTLGSRSSLRCSPAPGPQHASPAPLTSPFQSPSKELEGDPRVRKPRGRGTASTTPAPNRYQLRQRPVPCSRQPNGTPTSRARRLR